MSPERITRTRGAACTTAEPTAFRQGVAPAERLCQTAPGGRASLSDGAKLSRELTARSQEVFLIDEREERFDHIGIELFARAGGDLV